MKQIKMTLIVVVIAIVASSVWAAAPSQPANRYTVSKDGTTTKDNKTGLTWQRVPPFEEYEWDDAKAYCKNLRLAGFSDWRLPTEGELEGISGANRSKDALTNGMGDSYSYSSSTPGYCCDRVMPVSFKTGEDGTEREGTYAALRVRCVR